jgi:hypothetical protein
MSRRISEDAFHPGFKDGRAWLIDLVNILLFQYVVLGGRVFNS